LKWLLFKLAFFYPKIFAFHSYYRKKQKRREYEDKVLFLYPEKEKNPKRLKKSLRGYLN